MALENLPVLALLIANGLIALRLVRDNPRRALLAYLFTAIDAMILVYALLSPGRTYPPEWPWQTVLRQPSFLYCLTILALTALSLRPLLVLWTGTCVAVAWAVGSWLVATSPGAIVGMGDLGAAATPAQYLERYLDPHYVHPDDASVRVFITLLITAILAAAVARARRLVHEQAEVARERANLARYLAPNVVDRLARSDRPFAAVRSQELAVMFVDIKGFTTIAEALSPEQTMDLLRVCHGHVATAIFRHDGTLDKFIGDGVMATFGMPEPGADDAARALACALDILETLDGWNDVRRRSDRPPIEVGIGLHLGPATLGDIGTARRLELAVIGDAVNVASRLERLTRERGCSLAISEALRSAAERQGASLPALASIGPQFLRGRAEPLDVWVLPPAAVDPGTAAA